MSNFNSSDESEIRKRAKTEPVKRRGNRNSRIPEILECAIQVFASSGDIGFTQRRIAAEAGIRLGTLQHYFDTRDALLKATIEESSRRYLEHSRGIIWDFRLTPEERLAAFVDHTFETFSDPATLVSPFALEFWALAERNDSVRELFELNSEGYLSLFSELVGQINTQLTVEEARVRGAYIYSHWEGLLVFLRRTRFGLVQPLSLKVIVKRQWTSIARLASDFSKEV
ncbi:TetR/AcrR family transcriptional regulator [Burkholderia anthina]|uniref:TetR/AcrR family transcriptional regulator n=1 Tax=Burkholderia anthina TaxID=179879 RepID=UPI00158CAAFA|nr:TetR/AcrR family transcriptional regulator [Burkholderia anthina]